MRTLSYTMGCVILVLTGCGGIPGAAAPEKTPSSSELTAAGDALCQEHGVLEAVCTKCNPALVAVFQAKGDWCAEHGFPESFCPECNPASGGRPATSVAADEAPADGTKVRFKSKETARLAGLRYAHVSAAADDGSTIVVTARIAYDATKRAEVNARLPGVVRAVHADVGTVVAAGSPLTSIESAELGTEQSHLLAARSRAQVAEANHARLTTLHREGIAPENEVLAARQELDAASADLAATEAGLAMVGNTAEGGSRYKLTAPLAGVVIGRHATVGRLVDTTEVLFEIVDTSTVWAEIDIPEGEVSRVHVGRPVTLTVSALGDREFSGRLAYVAPEIDTHTRTAKGRVLLANADGALLGNMFARASIPVAAAPGAMIVPREAVQRAANAHLVFVRLAEDLFEARRVQVGAAAGDRVEVRGRLAPADEVVTDGSFLLKTETLKGSIGAGCCEVEQD